MIQGRCRLWNLTLCALAFLFIYNLILTMKLVYSPECHKHQTPVVKPVKPARQKCEPIGTNQNTRTFNLDLTLGRWDNAQRYKLFDNILVGDRFAPLNDLYKTCLATQSSLDKLPSLAEVASHWSGPISLALFAASGPELDALLSYVAYLRKCDQGIRDRVSFHLGMARERLPRTFDLDEDKLEEMDCRKPLEVLRNLYEASTMTASRWRTKLAYPQNHLRNLARKNCQSKHVFLTDVDIVPSRGAAEGLDVFLEQAKCPGDGKCAYVVPTYEIDERVRFPRNKSELVRLAEKGLARPFHHKVFIYNQYATNFTRWQAHSNDGPNIHISHPVTNFEFLYEPFYIAPDTVPPHDERFVGYGYTRNSQVYEMFVAGYEFLVLSPIFTCHWGLQVKRSRPPWREHQNNLNRKQFDAFKREIFAKYNKDPLNMMANHKT
ncbi:unnamed protein product [Phaedon cochleariae]|uniref:Beta-1,4-glucuronyltransferase 1 n=1 Tax=Phaedon cochleariae TaxID=80249 RepID=A0A9P0GPH5_PHACE|nr:unnamed protein product [Phaedon cochleariae]